MEEMLINEGWKFDKEKRYEGWDIVEKTYYKHGFGIKLTIVKDKVIQLDIKEGYGRDKLNLMDKELEGFSIEDLNYICKLLKIN